MIPIGRGQRELIIGDRQTGKGPPPRHRHHHQPEGALDVNLHLCRHRARKQVRRWPPSVEQAARVRAPWTTRSVVRRHRVGSRPPLQFLAPFTGVTIRRVLAGQNGPARAHFIYDDLSKHAVALPAAYLCCFADLLDAESLSRRTVFYLHSRLLDAAPARCRR